MEVFGGFRDTQLESNSAITVFPAKSPPRQIVLPREVIASTLQSLVVNFDGYLTTASVIQTKPI